MKIFSQWDPDGDARQAERCALWVRSWRARGWEPRILTARDKGRKILTHFGCINFALQSDGKVQPVRAGAAGWETAAVVDFGPDVSPDTIVDRMLEC